MSYPSLEHMPGPTEAAKPLQLEQHHAYDGFYEAWNAADKVGQVDANHFPTTLAFEGAWKRYKESVFKLEELLGEQAHCAQVDTMLWSDFSDIYKDIVTCRPSELHFTRAQVLEWLKRENISSHFVA